jgi:two-component system sensor histidine kinase/response regulator
VPRQSRILIVDDNARNVDILKKILGRQYPLATATSGEEALDAAVRFHPDLVLLDIMMPGIDGYETCRRLRANPALRWLKVIMVSAKAMVSERVQGYAAGADDYLTKPFDEDELLAKVRVHLRLRSVEEVDDLKSSILGLLSHETRTPLNALIGPAEFLMTDDTLDAEERKQWAAVIHRGARRLLHLFDNVLTLAGLKSGALELRLEESDLRVLVAQAVAAVEARATERAVVVEQALDGPAVVAVDRSVMLSALTSLLDGAIRASPEQGRVTAAVSCAEGQVHVAVSHQGAGMDLERVREIFVAFPSGDLEQPPESQAWDLAIARQVMLAHQGDIAVESAGESGARFTIELPLATVSRPGDGR